MKKFFESDPEGKTKHEKLTKRHEEEEADLLTYILKQQEEREKAQKANPGAALN